MPLAALSMLSSPSGAQAGGGKIPGLSQEAKSGSSLDSSGSSYNLGSGSPGDLIVGGSKNNTWMILAAVAVVAFVAFRK